MKSVVNLWAVLTAALVSGFAWAGASDEWIVSDAPVPVADCDGATVLRYGYTWVPQVPPRLRGDATFQEGNDASREKIALKKSSEIESNYIGVNLTLMPRSREADDQPLESINLIDGDDQTCWMSKGFRRPDLAPIWIRVDLPVETPICKIVLKKRPILSRRPPYAAQPMGGAQEVGRGVPIEMKIESSVDTYDWTTLFNGATGDAPEKDSFELNFEPTLAKQIRIEASRLPLVESLYGFSLAEVEIFDANGENVAKITNGAGISVSSTDRGAGLEIEQHRWMHPLINEMGCKWARIGYHDGAIDWHRVETEKGKFEVDPVSDAAITELAEHNVNIIMCLNFGNRLYSGPEERAFPQMWEWFFDQPKPPTTEEALQAWERYVEFIVAKYKDRVKYFEVWNEWDGALYWGDRVSLENYLTLAKRTIPIIRRIAPDAKILAGSVSGGMFPMGCRNWTQEDWDARSQQGTCLPMNRELASLVDVIAWHPYYNQEPNELLDYPEDVVAYCKWLRSIGFQGEFMSTEWNLSLAYPPFLPEDRGRFWQGQLELSEMEKAIYSSQYFVQDAGLDLASCFCTIFGPFGNCDLSLMRRAVDSDPVQSLQPQAAFYMARNLATIMDGYKPAEFGYSAQAANDVALRSFSFETKTGKAIGLWRKGHVADPNEKFLTTITIDGEYSSVKACDPANGVSQTLNARTQDGKTIVEGVFVDSVPLLVSFE